MKNLEFLKQLAHAKNKKKLLKTATASQLNAIRNVCYNLCKGRFKLPPKIYKKISRHRRCIRDLANKKKLKSVQGIRKRLIQHGGFLGALLPAILGLISTVGGRALSKAVGV